MPEIRTGSDIWIVLRNRFGTVKYTESYHLTNIVMSEDRFWAKFGEIHASHGLAALTCEAFDRRAPMAFAYNNFAPVVCNMATTGSKARFFSSHAYAEMRFIAPRKYTRLWRFGSRGTEAVAQAVVEGRALKLRVHSTDNYHYTIPLHTVEAEVDGGFTAYSWYDGYPDILRHFSFAEVISNSLVEMNANVPEYSSSNVLDADFFHPYFRVSSRDGAFMINPLTNEIKPFETNSIEIFGEC